MKRSILAIVTFVLSSAALTAQAPPPPEDMLYVQTAGAGAVGHEFHFVSAEGMDLRLVKGAPYSAQAVTETTQTLADGNRIQRKVTAQVYRDSEGRTRREQSLPGIGPFAASGKALEDIFIHDPVAGHNYILQPEEHTATRLPAGPGSGPMRIEMRRQVTESVETGGKAVSGTITATASAVRGPMVTPFPKTSGDARTEPLGTQVMEGVSAEGTRTTTTLAAGTIGNERPIEIVSERWYSPQLQVVVLSKRSDPRVGETVYRLTNLSLSEPDHSLFEIPAGYSVSEDPAARGLQIQKLPAEK